ncbi:RYamide receptor-like [Adelges cooleyi]|uniref:RYamide receptor-like n=1 Tax=Adelges cooleyi TaxID=133065 RepID=UPI00217F7706|nr:RYamide receptor-like [Adelges cooleyi]
MIPSFMLLGLLINESGCFEMVVGNISTANVTVNVLCNVKPGSLTANDFSQVIGLLMGTTVLTVAVIGNGLVCYIVIFSYQMRSLINLLIVNIAVSDLFLSLLYVPFLLYVLFLNHWPFGNRLCYMFCYSIAVAVQVSSYTMVAISVNRYIAVVWPLRTRASRKHTKSIIAVVWVVAAISSLPFLYITSVEQPSIWYQKCELYVCFGSRWNENVPRVYKELLITMQMLIPGSILLFTYGSIAVALWRRRRKQRSVTLPKSNIKTIQMMIIIVIAFIVSWTPFNIFLTLTNTDPLLSMITRDEHSHLWFLLYWMGMSHSCYNPIICICMNDQYQIEFIGLMHRILGCGRFTHMLRRPITA